MPFFLPSTGYLRVGGTLDNSISYVFGPKNGIDSYGYDLNEYVGKTWYKINGQSGTFTSPLDLDSFYGTGPFTPVVPGGYRLYIGGYYPGISLPSGYTNISSDISGSITIPDYVNLTIDVYGSSGGGGGGAGNGHNGGNGGSGGSTVFGNSDQSWYVSGPGGGGGLAGLIYGPTQAQGTPGLGSIGYPTGGNGGAAHFSGTYSGSSGTQGGAGGHTRLIVTNPSYGPINPYTGLYTPLGPPQGSVITFSIGSIGAGGGGGQSGGILGNGDSGSSGNYGWIDIGWS